MKIIFTFVLALLVNVFVIAQTAPPITGDAPPPPSKDQTTDEISYPELVGPEVHDTDEVYSFAEEMPMFPGGDSAWKAYVRSVMSYPPEAFAQGIQGTVYVQFVVEMDGSITGCIVRKHPNSQALADEALRIMSHSPKWIPGKMNGKAVRVQMIMPFRFVLPQ